MHIHQKLFYQKSKIISQINTIKNYTNNYQKLNKPKLFIMEN